jgi:hypothetical protein
MLCYRDTTFCSSKVNKHACNREFTKQDAIDAEKWWGGKDYPVAYGKFCLEISDEQIKRMVTRFLHWTIPEDFSPDGGISYEKPRLPQWPVTGTNLLNATQAEKMIRYITEGL